MAGNVRKGKGSALDYNQVVRVVFAQAEALGISDRAAVEELANEVIARLERPLPGMEELVSAWPRRGAAPTPARIQALVKEALAQRDRPSPPVKAPPSFKLPTPLPPAGEEEGGGEIRLTDNALRVLERRYLGKDERGGVVETPQEMFRRVARNIASAEVRHGPEAGGWEERFYRMMTELEFLPNSPTLMNAGRELQQLSACFVIPVEDSMESIFDAVKYTALIHKSGGGTGFSFSRLRPESDRVGSTGGVASGPVSFMRAFDTATDVIKQGGMRRGANMAILNVDHPDILKFIRAKEDPKALNNFNLSVAATDEFMRAVEKGEEYDLINPHTKQAVGRLKAKEVFDLMVEMAWRGGDPGVVFIDRINRDNPTPRLGRIESTNPCGEQPLLPYESCNLGSINLSRMTRRGEKGVEVDWERLEGTVRTAVRFLDGVIDVNRFPLPEIGERTRLTRKVGLGVMGFADMLFQMGIAYDSEAGLEVAERVMGFIEEKARQASAGLGEERGAFPAFEGSSYDRPGGLRMRNAAVTTIAPTGTLSIIAGCSSGIEPVFALSYVRNILDGEQFTEVNPYFEEVARREGFYSEGLMGELARGGGVRGREEVPESWQRVFVSAHEITPEWHVRMQAAFQRHTDAAVSKTVNFPHRATKEDVARAYMLAYKEGCKGITIYRDRSRESQVLSLGGEEKAGGKAALAPRRRPRITRGVTERVTTGCGNIYVTVNRDEEGMCEVFSTLGKAGGCPAAQLEAICRLISLALRSGIEVRSVVKHLRGIRCPSIAWEEGHAVLSCADAIGSVLEKHLGEGEEGGAGSPEDYGLARNAMGSCPECGGGLVFQEGCYICVSCGYTKCS